MTHKYVNSKIQQAFDVAMLGRQYGEEERQHAFAWFAEGWQRAMTAPAHDEERVRCPCCNSDNVNDSPQNTKRGWSQCEDCKCLWHRDRRQARATAAEGMVLVPMEPTSEMILAAVKSQSNRVTIPRDDELAAGFYYAMISAAPGRDV